MGKNLTFWYFCQGPGFAPELRLLSSLDSPLELRVCEELVLQERGWSLVALKLTKVMKIII